MKRWLRGQIEVASFRASDDLRAFLYTPDSPAFNTGILGGALPVFDQVRVSLSQLTRDHYDHLARQELQARMVVDMLALNQVRAVLIHARRATISLQYNQPTLPACGYSHVAAWFLRAPTMCVCMCSPYTRAVSIHKMSFAFHTSRLSQVLLGWPSPIVTGFPDGPVNMPMFGNLCRPWNPCDEDFNASAVDAYYAQGSQPSLSVAPRKRIRIVEQQYLPHATTHDGVRAGANSGGRGPGRTSRGGGRGWPGTPGPDVRGAAPSVTYTNAPGFGLRASRMPRVSAPRNATRNACYKSVLRDLAVHPFYYFRHKLYCGNSIPC